MLPMPSFGPDLPPENTVVDTHVYLNVKGAFTWKHCFQERLYGETTETCPQKTPSRRPRSLSDRLPSGRTFAFAANGWRIRIKGWGTRRWSAGRFSRGC